MLKGINKANAGFMVVFSALALGACGGSSSSSSSNNSATELKPGVFYMGKKLSADEELVGESFISSTGKFVIFLRNESEVDGGLVVEKSFTFGNLQYSSGKLSSQIEEYKYLNPPEADASWDRLEGSLFGDLKSSKRADLTSSISESSPITKGVLYRDDKRSDPNLTINDIYNSFMMTNSGTTTTVTITPDSSDESKGTFVVNQGDTCNGNGEVSIPDQAINVFEVTYKVSNCPSSTDENAAQGLRDGDYSGLGTYDAKAVDSTNNRSTAHL
ncbi:MAG: hypothetical protein L0J77_09830 [Marinobacter sp.]|nr:hypothetical protein [Marinobacter sp.]